MDNNGHHKAKFKYEDDWVKLVISNPFIGIYISESHNAPFDALGFAIFIIFHGRYGYCGKRWTNNVFGFRILGLRDSCPCREVFEAKVLFIITLLPDILVKRVDLLHVQESWIIKVAKGDIRKMLRNRGYTVRLMVGVKDGVEE